MTGTASARVKLPVWESRILILGLSLFAETFRATDRRAGACGAGQLEDRAAIGQQLVEFGGGPLAFQDHVGADVGGIQGFVGAHAAVHDNHRDVGILGLSQDGIPAILDHRGQRDHVHALLDAGAHGRDLVLLLLLGVREDQLLDTQRRRRLFK